MLISLIIQQSQKKLTEQKQCLGETMFGKKKVRDQEPSFQKNAEYSVPAEDDKREIEDKNKSAINLQSARLSSDAQIEGAIKFDGIMIIDGNVNGEISAENGELVVSIPRR